MNRSLLISQQHRIGADSDSAPVVIALHRRGGSAGDSLPMFAHTDTPITILMPQALRPVVPDTRGYRPDATGYHWYFGDEPWLPEPSTFGESLWSLEGFVLDVRERRPGGKTIVVGAGQGAYLAVALAAVIPDWIDSVLAVDGGLPTIRGWSPPTERAAPGLAMVFVRDAARGAAISPPLAAALDHFEAIGASTDLWDAPGVSGAPETLARHVSLWLADRAMP